MALIDIDLTTDTAIGNRDPLPAGDYAVMIVATEQRETKSGTGSYLNIEMEVVDGEFAGRKVWDRLNLWNSNAKAVELARRTLKAITEATGHPPRVVDSETLHGKSLLATVIVKQDVGYQPSNEVKGYRALGGARPAVAPAARSAASPRPVWAAK